MAYLKKVLTVVFMLAVGMATAANGANPLKASAEDDPLFVVSEVKMYIGMGSAHLEEFLTPKYLNISGLSLVCSSDNPEVVTTGSEGLVNLVGLGEATITCQAKNGYKVLTVQTLKITVYDEEIIVSPDNTQIIGNCGETQTIRVSCKLNTQVHTAIFKSDDRKIVDYGNNTSDEYIARPLGEESASCVLYFKNPGTTNLNITIYSQSPSDPDAFVVKRTIPVTTRTPKISITLDGKVVSTLSKPVLSTTTLIAKTENCSAGDVRWSTSDPEVVSISSTSGNRCTFVAKKVGTAVIKTSFRGMYDGESVVVKVIPDNTNLSITLDKDKTYLAKGAEERLSFSSEPVTVTSKDLKWTSSNNNVVTVDENGNIKGVSKGTAVVTVSFVNAPEVSSSCTVKVYELKALPAELISTDGFTACWEPFEDASYFIVYTDNESNFVYTDSNCNRQEVLVKADGSRTHTYWIKAVLKDNTVLPASNRVNVRLLELLPSPVANKTVTREAGNVVAMKWSVPNNAGKGCFLYITAIDYDGTVYEAQQFDVETLREAAFKFSENIKAFEFFLTTYSYQGEESVPSNIVYANVSDKDGIDEIYRDSDNEHMNVLIDGLTVTVSGLAKDETVAIYTVTGNRIYNGHKHTIQLTPGVYIIQAHGQVKKVIINNK